jgi:hypothetical protein
MKEILIGGITGLLISTSLYVWNSNNFTKEQRILLLICVVFPPAQWVGIIIVLIYNNNKLENTHEKLSEKKVTEKKIKLNSTIDNLLELKEKGILTIDEYNEKVDKIESQKIEVEIENSSEYKQLKNLFENNILTLDEFEIKIKLLQTDEIFKRIVRRNELENSNSLKTVYRETTDNKTLKIISEINQTIGADVFIEDLPAPDGIYNYKSKTHKLILENGKIKERFFIKKYKTFFIEQKSENIVSLGDKVYLLDEKQIEDGKYNLGFGLGNIIVENGILIKL